MQYEIANYKVVPQVVESGKPRRITISPLGTHARFEEGAFYDITLIPMARYQSLKRLTEPKSIHIIPMTVQAEGGALAFTYTFHGEQEWTILVAPQRGGTSRRFHLYSLLDDLYDKTPYKGDFHVHSYYSGGKEEPAVVAANYRKSGFDFLAITDHLRWFPSREAIDRLAPLPAGLRLFPGEEVHVPSMYIHYVNFGGAYSVNDLYYQNKAHWDAEIAAQADQLEAPPAVDALEYAYRRWVHRQIQQSGGLSILTHPNWVWLDQYNAADSMVEYLFETRCFDVFEVLGGQSVQENNLQTALYHEQRALGKSVPIVGSSDSHGTEPPVFFDSCKTILFAKGLTLPHIRDAVMQLYSVAVETMPGEQYRLFGPLRLVKYAHFLMEYYFPPRDALCAMEGMLLKQHLTGQASVAAEIAAAARQVGQFTERFFGKTPAAEEDASASE